MPDVLDAVSAGEADAGFVPIENSIEGMVNFTLDALAFDHELLIVREVVLDIHLCLAARPGRPSRGRQGDPVDPGRDRAVPSLPARVPAVRRRAQRALHRGAAQLVSEDPAPHLAAIAPQVAAERYGLDVLAENIEDHDGNQTRFVLVRTVRASRHRPATTARRWSCTSAPTSRAA